MHILKQLFTSLESATFLPVDDNFILPSIIARLLKSIILKIDNLFHKPSRKPVEFDAPHSDYFNYFPTFKKNYKLPVYEVDQTNLSSSSCTKIYPIHQRFSPGLLVIACEHKICYGFQIMRQRESTISIFNTLSTHFKRQPRIIIYDNAYNLHTTCTIRDPKLFRNTTFLIDRFHTKNHKCNASYRMNSIKTEEIVNINSQTCEQLFSSLRKISTQITYMNIQNVFYNTRYFLACWNNMADINQNS